MTTKRDASHAGWRKVRVRVLQRDGQVCQIGSPS